MQAIKPEKFISEILEIKNLSPSVKHIKLSVPEKFEFVPGQYVSIIMEKNGNKIRRPYSICSKNNEKNFIELCIKIVEGGMASEIIKEKTIGNKVEILGPLGNFIIEESSKKKDRLFISNGTGIGPFRSMIKTMLGNEFKNKITLIAGYRENILYKEEFRELEKKHANFSHKVALSSQGKRVQDLLEEFIDKKADYYLCGLKDMINSVRSILAKEEIEMKNIYSEKYD